MPASFSKAKFRYYSGFLFLSFLVWVGVVGGKEGISSNFGVISCLAGPSNFPLCSYSFTTKLPKSGHPYVFCIFFLPPKSSSFWRLPLPSTHVWKTSPVIQILFGSFRFRVHSVFLAVVLRDPRSRLAPFCSLPCPSYRSVCFSNNRSRVWVGKEQKLNPRI